MKMSIILSQCPYDAADRRHALQSVICAALRFLRYVLARVARPFLAAIVIQETYRGRTYGGQCS
jgi:hypothetical protein